jgi:hypothetical protein
VEVEAVRWPKASRSRGGKALQKGVAHSPRRLFRAVVFYGACFEEKCFPRRDIARGYVGYSLSLAPERKIQSPSGLATFC